MVFHSQEKKETTTYNVIVRHIRATIFALEKQ